MATEALFGIETEYAYSVHGQDGTAFDRRRALRELTRALREQVRWLPGSGDRAFLVNGALFYIDRGGHPELTTPECKSPWDVVLYTVAGERMLSTAAATAAQRHPNTRPLLLKTNVDYLSQQTWGCHESYLTTLAPSAFKRNLIPHLVTRIIYTGAGGFGRNERGGLAFAISPRVGFLDTEVAGGSTESRGILHAKNEPLAARPYHRLHLICGESVSSRIAQLLRVGTTALVVRMIENGMCKRAPVALRDPVRAMRTISADPTLQATVKPTRRREMTAIAIQRYYLETAESCAHSSFMPSWAPEICAHWREMLDALESGGSMAAVTRLDWGMKLGLFGRLCERAGFSLEDLPRWDAAVGDINGEAAAAAREASESLLYDHPEFVRSRLGLMRRPRSTPGAAPIGEPDRVKMAREALSAAGLPTARLDDFLRLRAELLETDARFAQLGEGIYARLHAAGVLEDGIDGLDDASLELAMTQAPGGRARARAAVVQEHGNSERTERFQVDWDKIVDVETRQILDLTDPLNETARWQCLSDFKKRAPPSSTSELLLAELLEATSSRRR